MRLRRLVVAGGAAGAAAVLFLRRRGATAERVEIAYADGSTFTLDPGSLPWERLLALGREALASTRS
jgi:hypothetical protein